MNRSFQRQAQRSREGRAAALEDFDRQASSPSDSRARRRQAGEDSAAAWSGRNSATQAELRLGRHRKAAQVIVGGLAEPAEERMAASGAQRLLGGPEGIAPARRADDRQVLQIHPGGGERRGIRQVRRSQPDHALAGPRQGRQGRQDELQLADAFPAAQKLGQRPARPPAAGQLGIKNSMAGGNGGNPELRGAAEPDRVLPEEFFEGRHGEARILYMRPALTSPRCQELPGSGILGLGRPHRGDGWSSPSTAPEGVRGVWVCVSPATLDLRQGRGR